MPEIASRAERLGRIRKGYLKSGSSGIERTTRLFGNTNTEKFANWSTAKNALDRNMHLKPHVRKKPKTEAETKSINMQKAYDDRERRRSELRSQRAR